MSPTPSNHQTFDPWNPSSTGHERAENPYSATTAWRHARQEKLKVQFTPGADSKGKNSTEGEWKWLSAEEAKRHQSECRNIRTFLGRVKKRERDGDDTSMDGSMRKKRVVSPAPAPAPVLDDNTPTPTTTPTPDKDPKSERKILSGTTIYINGSTMPHISDHKLKHLLVAHGASIALSMARKSVSHVIVGEPNCDTSGGGAGGGLAAGKLQREIERGGYKGVKVVGVGWALESVKAGKRLSEARFALNLAPKGQRSVLRMFARS